MYSESEKDNVNVFLENARLQKELEEMKEKADKVIDLIPRILQKLKEKGEPIELYAIIEALSNYRKDSPT